MKKSELIRELEKYPDDSEIQIEVPYNVGNGQEFSKSDIGGIRFEVRARGEGFSEPTITFVP